MTSIPGSIFERNSIKDLRRLLIHNLEYPGDAVANTLMISYHQLSLQASNYARANHTNKKYSCSTKVKKINYLSCFCAFHCEPSPFTIAPFKFPITRIMKN